MDHVRLFLKTPFFAYPQRSSNNTPYQRARVLDGTIVEAPGGVRIAVTAWRDGNGVVLNDIPACSLVIPTGKIDHMLILGEES